VDIAHLGIIGRGFWMEESKPKNLREEYVNAKMKKNWITGSLNKLTHEQVDLLYGMMKRWLKETETC